MNRTMAAPVLSKILIYTMLIVISLIMVYPLILMVITSLKTPQEIASASFIFIPKKLQFYNYVEAMGRGDWGRYFWNTFYVAFMSVLISLIINSLAGYAFARLEFKGRDLLFIFALIGMMVPPQSIMIPLFVIMRRIPLLGGNDLLGQGGMGLINTYMAIMFPYIAGPFGVFLFRQFLLNFPKSLDDAAKIDGLGKLKTFLYIYVPLSKPVFVTLAVMKLNQVWNEYVWPLVITTDAKMKTVQLALALFYGEFEIKWHLLMAANTLITIPVVLLFLFAKRYYVEGIVTTGSKG
jgi:multiple sugar transport system permease protein